MISGVSGIIEAIGSNWAIIDVGGISFQVFLPTSTLSTLGVVGQKVRLHTHLNVREDNLTLFGFSSARELSLFQTLISVSGIGPKLGLAMLSTMDAEQLTAAIASGDAALLTSIPGVGKKTAERIVLELKEKIGDAWITQDLEAVHGNSEVVAALTSLGYSVTEATRAVASLPLTQMSLEEKVKLALKYFGEK
ncbi:MAG: Holliday junction branch migration protein RuvA [Dehalococcoidales bacterium]|nr:Holliday junction branch migration protein RuvA [Dehalococcoidales bacterium]